jgi:hypothetical protein
MADSPNKRDNQSLTELPAAPSIGELLGVTPILPGELEASYTAGLNAVIEELDAKTTLQVYLAEKIYDCLWWIRRYEDQKRTTIISEMAHQTEKGYSRELTQKEVDVREALLRDNINSRVLKTIGEVGHSIESLRQSAYARKREEIMQLDQQIALQVKILASFQGSYELAFNRKLNVERLTLQNALMRRDLGAIDEVIDDSPKETPALKGTIGGKPKAARRK